MQQFQGCCTETRGACSNAAAPGVEAHRSDSSDVIIYYRTSIGVLAWDEAIRRDIGDSSSDCLGDCLQASQPVDCTLSSDGQKC